MEKATERCCTCQWCLKLRLPCWHVRIGAVHCVVFGGFSPDSLASRIEGQPKAKLVITADAGMRGSKLDSIEENVDAALDIQGTDRCRERNGIGCTVQAA